MDGRFGRGGSRGFTLLEVMVVVVILGILAALVVPNLAGYSDDARIVAAKQEIKSLEAALEMYRVDNAHYPATDQGLEALVSKPAGSPEPKNYRSGGYIKRLSKDPWGNDYLYLRPGHRGGDFDLYTLGGDGVEGGEGADADIGNWNLE